MESFWSITAYCLILLAPCLVAVRNFTPESEPWGSQQPKA
jgi:hypothetical protein